MSAMIAGGKLPLLARGTRLGPYTIVELIGVGGMGEVYRAEDTRLHRDVAIKVLPQPLADDRSSLDRFQREARAVASLSHPNILSIFDYGAESGVHYAVTEMLEGRTLRSKLAEGPLTPGAALEVLLQIADGVAAAHARGIVHRDLKPENIFITSAGRVKVLDFGLARGGDVFRPRDAAAPEVLLTEPGIVLGTVGYLAPEQVEAHPLTPAADVFALGCILFEMVSGRLPFEGSSAMQSMVAVLHDPTPRLPATADPLSPVIDALVQRCLEKSPIARFQNAGELADAIRDALTGGKATARLTAKYRKPRFSKRVVALLLVALIASVAGVVLFRNRDRQIDHGYDVRLSDIRGDAETARLVELALRADAEGNRPKATQLLSEAARRPSKTPLPAALLASYNNGAGNDALARQWAQQAASRLEGASPYESLLVRFLCEGRGYTTTELALAKSALELRPAAWRLRLAAAHIHIGQRDREAARRELQQIDVTKPDDRRLMLVLADRASLGDIDGAERSLRSSRLMRRPAMLHYTEARIAWSRGDAKRARDLFDQAAAEASAESLTPLEAEARLLSGIALVRLGLWDEAQRRFAAAATRGRQAGLEHRVFESAAFAAYAAHRAGDFEERDRKLREAAQVDPPPHPLASLRLLAIRLGSEEWKRWSVASLEKEPELASTLALIRAREAKNAGDVELARTELRRARAEGIDTAEEREEAELLAAELGLPATLLPPDPPYPNMLRYLTIFDHEAFVRGS